MNSVGFREVGYFDCPGGGQVVVRGDVAFIGHQRWPDGTTLIDVADPKNPRVLSTIDGLLPFTHSHKVRCVGDIMLINYEAMAHLGPTPPDFEGGLGIFDVSKPDRPRKIAHWHAAGVHRFTFDGRYAYISPQMEGFVGNIVLILDLADPSQPQEVSRWWQPGQWIAGGEVPAWDTSNPDMVPRCHHPIRHGDLLFTSYWHGGGHVLDISNIARPRLVSSLSWNPPFPWPTHTLLPIAFPIRGRRYMVVADEDALPKASGPGPYLWMVDITDPKHPIPVSTFDIPLPDGVGGNNPAHHGHVGLHQPAEDSPSTEIPVAWHTFGVRLIDIANPHAMREVAHFIPPVPEGCKEVQTNDVCHDERGLIYLVDRRRGLHIVERT